MQDMENMKNFIGRCNNCGREQSTFAVSQKIADRMVTENCDCKGGDIKEKRILMHRQLNTLCGEEAPDYGFEAVRPGTYDVILDIADLVVEGKIQTATFKIDGTTISMSNAGGKIRAKRSQKIEQGGNIEQ